MEARANGTEAVAEYARLRTEDLTCEKNRRQIVGEIGVVVGSVEAGGDGRRVAGSVLADAEGGFRIEVPPNFQGSLHATLGNLRDQKNLRRTSMGGIVAGQTGVTLRFEP